MREYFKRLNNNKNKTQLYKLCETISVCTLLLFIVEVLFQIPTIKNLFDPSNNLGQSFGIYTWIILWVLMFLQVTIIPIPMLPILLLCNKTTLVADGSGLIDLFSWKTLGFCVFCATAITAGSAVAYLLGKLFGRKAVKWAAGDEDEFDKWSNAFNSKKGKFIYGLTVLLPIFPDDLISIVMGAVKMDFMYFIIVHAVCSVIGTFTMLVFMRLPYVEQFFNSGGGEFPVAMLVYAILSIIFFILSLVIKKSVKKNLV